MTARETTIIRTYPYLGCGRLLEYESAPYSPLRLFSLVRSGHGGVLLAFEIFSDCIISVQGRAKSLVCFPAPSPAAARYADWYCSGCSVELPSENFSSNPSRFILALGYDE